MSNLITQDYIEQLQKTHGEDRYWGGTGYKYAEKILSLAKQYKCFDALDYGSSHHRNCLKQHFHRHYPGELLIYEYDPGVPSKSALPDPADILICTDVLEHVEPELLDNVLRHMESCMLLCGFMVISTVPAKTILDDGRNAHLIVEDKDWWIEKVKTVFNVFKAGWNNSTVHIFVAKGEM